MTDSGIQTYSLGTFTTQAGETIKDAFLAYKTFGDASLPAIVYPTWYSGAIADNEWLVGTKENQLKALNPERYFIVIVAMFGNGQSSSPSNYQHGTFPATTMYDNVKAQHQLVTSHFKIQHLHAVVGWSMGAGQTFQWGAAYPGFIDYIVPFCGAARTAEHNKTFLYSLINTIKLDKAWDSPSEDATEGKKAFASIYSAWGFSQAFYRQKLYQQLGFETLDDFLKRFWEPLFGQKDARNLVHMLNTWISGDITCTPDRAFSHKTAERSSDDDFKKALESITAKTLVMPGKTDLYFPPEDSEFEVEHLPNGTLDVIPSVWGHFAGGPGTNLEDVKYIDAAIVALFSEGQKTKL